MMEADSLDQKSKHYSCYNNHNTSTMSTSTPQAFDTSSLRTSTLNITLSEKNRPLNFPSPVHQHPTNRQYRRSSSLPPTPLLLMNHPLLLVLVLMLFASSRLSVLCFNPLVAATSGGLGSSRLSPYNLTVTAVYARAATVHWEVSSPYLPPPPQHGANSSSGTNLDEPVIITSFEMTLKRTFPQTHQSGDGDGESDSDNNYEIVPSETSRSGRRQNSSPVSSSLSSSSIYSATVSKLLDGSKRSFTFRNLSPRTEYQVYIKALGIDASGNTSETVTFTTLEEQHRHIPPPKFHPAEVVLVVLMLIAWFCAIALFLHKWGKIRIIQPREPRFKHSPKNLETIKVVKKPTDSVIHKHYTRQVSKNMVARENRRIERMNTMPNIKVNTEAIRAHEKMEKKFQTMPVIEMETLSPEGEAQVEEGQT